MGREHRRYPRIGPVLVRTTFAHGNDGWEGFLTSLSEGGAYLVTEEPISEGETISLRFFLPWGLGVVDTEAKVVYAITEAVPKPDGYPTGIGLAFTSLSEEAVERLRRYVARFQEIAAQLTGEAL